MSFIFIVIQPSYAIDPVPCSSSYKCLIGETRGYTESWCEYNLLEDRCETEYEGRTLFCTESGCSVQGFQNGCESTSPPCDNILLSGTGGTVNCCDTCDASDCPGCTPTCPSNYPNSSCDTTNGGRCDSIQKYCYMTDPCGESCVGGGPKTCYSDPTCTQRCTDGTHWDDEPTVPLNIITMISYKYIYSDCDDDMSCYSCSPERCTACNPSSTTYSASKPSNTYRAGTCTWTASTCHTSSRSCYHSCPVATCEYLYSQTGIDTWIDGACPGGESDPTCSQVTMPVDIPIPDGGSNFPTYPRSIDSNYTCPREKELTCHLPNRNPEMLSIKALRIPPDYDIIRGYVNTGFSGKDFNNPVQVEASYGDADGSNDIMALYVWWTSDDDGVQSFLTPKEVYNLSSLNGQSTNQQNFGFMIARSYDSAANDWTNARVYIPDHSTATSYWVDIGSVSQTLAIDNSQSSTPPTNDDFVVIDDIRIVPDSVGNKVDLTLEMYFTNDKFDPSISAYPDTRNYNLWGSVNDRIGYLPFNVPYYQSHTYNPYVILDSGADAWQNGGNDWHVDIINPTGDIAGKVLDSDYGIMKINVNAYDNENGNGGIQPSGLSYVRLDACKSGKDDIEALSYLDTDGEYHSYMPSDCEDPNNPYITDNGFEPPNMVNGLSLLGKAGGYEDNPLNMQSFSESAIVKLNNNLEGSLTYYLTVMDMAGNTNLADQDVEIYLIEQWAVVEGGLVFGKDSAISMTRELDNPLATFQASDVLKRLRNIENFDFTNQSLLSKNADLNLGLKSLIRATENNSFKSRSYPGLTMQYIYGEMKEAYENKSSNADFEQRELTSSQLGGDLRDPFGDPANVCSSPYCIWTWEASDPSDVLQFDSGFRCNGRGLFILNGDVRIIPDFTNEGPTDACIILVNGNITIEPTGVGNGTIISPPPPPQYDTVEAFLIANGHIEIPNIVSNPPDDKGLFVEGALLGFTPVSGPDSSVLNSREIYFANMGTYPVLVVQGNSKYGLLGRDFFGSQIDIYQSLQGFKPY